MTFICKKCCSDKYILKEKGPHLGLYCKNCGHWVQWIKKPKDFISHNIALTIKSNDNNENVTSNDDDKNVISNDDFPWD